MTHTSLYSQLQEGSLDPIMVIMDQFRNDPSPKKVDLSIGVYKPEDGDVKYVFPAVKKAKKEIYENDQGHPYHNMSGLPEFTSGAREVVFGKKSAHEGRIASLQTISGTGAVHMGLHLIKELGFNEVYVGVPTWSNYESMIKNHGCKVTFFNHYNFESHQVDIDATLEAIDKMPANAAILLQACCHNPTGADYSKDQWKLIADKIKAKNVYPFFDNAYQGFASGDKDEDAWAVRYFYEQNIDFLVCESFSKNMGLYGERAGCLHVVSTDKALVPNIQGTLVSFFRQQCSFAPLFGARIATYLFTDFKQEWDADVQFVTQRLRTIRQKIADKFKKLGTPGDWDFVTKQQGLFWYSGLNEAQATELKQKHHIYIPLNGRFNIAGFNDQNLDYIVEAIDDVLSK